MEGGREGRGGERRGRKGKGMEGGREGWRERRDDCYTYSNGSPYLNSNHVTYFVITCKSAFDWVYTEQWYGNYYVRRDVDTLSE